MNFNLTCRTVLALAATLAMLFGGLIPAYAEDGERVESFDITYAVQQNGSIRVTERIVWHFAAGEHRGIFRAFRTVQDWPPDPGQRRVFEVSKVRALDERGNPQPITTRQDGAASVIRIGAPDKPFTGPTTRTYLLEYTLDGIVNDRGRTAELQFNTRLDDPVEARQTRITVTGPTPATEVLCFQGPTGSTEPCAAAVGPPATFAATRILGARDNMTIGTIWPREAFGDLTPRLEPADRAAGIGQSMINPLPRIGAQIIAVVQGLLGLALLVFSALTAVRTLRHRRSEHFALPPGVLPREEAPIVRGRRRGPIPVRFEPPDGLGPAETDYALSGRVHHRHGVAALLDLVVQDRVSLQGTDEEQTFLALTEDPDDDELSTMDRLLLRTLRKDLEEAQADRVRLSEADQLGGGLGRVRGVLAELGQDWFVTHGRNWGKLFTLAFPVAFVGIGALVFNLLTPGGVDAYLPFRMPVATPALLLIGGSGYLGTTIALALPHRTRTALGTARAEQSEGFRTYLTTAEADQLRFEDAEQIFSRYLPYAVAFGVAEGWTKVFADVRGRAAATNHPLAEPVWMVTAGIDWNHLDSRIADLDRSTSSITRPGDADSPGEHSAGSGWFSSSSSSSGASGSWSGSSSDSSGRFSGGGDSGSSSGSW